MLPFPFLTYSNDEDAKLPCKKIWDGRLYVNDLKLYVKPGLCGGEGALTVN